MHSFLANIPIFITYFGAFMIAASVHEYSHGYAAYLLGDYTASSSGRLTLDPRAHIDPVGTILLPIVLIILKVPAIGWMKPVPVNPLNFKEPEKGHAIVAFAGPLSNFLLAVGAFAIFRIFMALEPSLVSVFKTSDAFYVDALSWAFQSGIILTLIFFRINILLMCFNMLPFPPLDGGWILRYILPSRAKVFYDRVYKYGFVILYIFIFLGFFSRVLNSIDNFSMSLLLGNNL